MLTKLTLSMDQEIIRQAKAYAKAQNRSLSSLIEAYLRALVKSQSTGLGESSAELSRLRGLFKEGAQKLSRADLADLLEEKYRTPE